MQKNSRDFPQVYTDLGIDASNLGCIMIDTQKIVISDIIDEADYYVSESSDKHYVKGNVSEDVPHCTLLYGLLRPGLEMRKHVDAVLASWKLPELIIDKVDFFYSNDPSEDYITIIALLKVNDELKEGNGLLRLLPHIDTFADYKPHITLAYVKSDADWHDYVDKLNKELAGTVVPAVSLNYGN